MSYPFQINDINERASIFILSVIVGSEGIINYFLLSLSVAWKCCFHLGRGGWGVVSRARLDGGA